MDIRVGNDGYSHISYGEGVFREGEKDNIFVSSLSGDHALVVAVVFQAHQDAERPVTQWNNGAYKRKVRTPV